jgi:8-oxo-dGTP pyrophosphatase MutT (NUDIX family)
MNRENLPLRKNCEGYLLSDDGKIVARLTNEGYIEFPGGGVDEGENILDAIQREAYEEAGVELSDLDLIYKLEFIWGDDWAQTEKQRKRFTKFRGKNRGKSIGTISVGHTR